MKAPKFVLQDKYLSIVVGGKPISLNASHPTFAAMKRAIERKTWTRIPKLISAAQQILSAGNGAVKMEKGDVYYHGRIVHSALTARIIQMVKEEKPISHMLKFMDNLYQNPSQECINELYEFLRINKLPITDDGCFMAYKTVNQNYMDVHSQTFDNSVGKILTMPRNKVDANRRELCSNGFHFCAKNYISGPNGFRGSHIMGVKINPKDVVSVPANGEGKGRTWRYEVVMEISEHTPAAVLQDAPMYLTSVLPVERDRKVLLGKVLAHPTIKRAVAKRRLKLRNIRKSTLGRPTKLYASLPATVTPQQPSKLDENPIKVARLQAGLAIGEVAKQAGVTSKEVYDAERFARVGQLKADTLLDAILVLQKTKLTLAQTATA